MANDPSAFTEAIGKMPWYAQFILMISMTFGIPTVIVCFRLAQDAGYIENPVQVQLEQLKGIAIQHDATLKAATDLLNRQAIALETEVKRRQKRCVLRATTQEQKEACFTE